MGRMLFLKLLDGDAGPATCFAFPNNMLIGAFYLGTGDGGVHFSEGLIWPNSACVIETLRKSTFFNGSISSDTQGL